MPKAIFTVPFPPETNLPPMGANDGYCLHYLDGAVLRGGYSIVGHVPEAPTCLVQVEASDAVLDQMALDPTYLFVEDVN